MAYSGSVGKLRERRELGKPMEADGSIWEDEKIIVKMLAQKINLSPEGGRASVVIAGPNSPDHQVATLMIKFSDYTTLPMFEGGVDAIPYLGEGSNLDEALNMAYNEMFHKSNGMRLAPSKTLVVITDGQEFEVNYSARGTLFRNANIRVIVIGIGNANAEHLRTLATTDSDLYIVNNFVYWKNDFIKEITFRPSKLLRISINILKCLKVKYIYIYIYIINNRYCCEAKLDCRKSTHGISGGKTCRISARIQW